MFKNGQSNCFLKTLFSLNLFNFFRNVCFCKLSLQHTGPTFLPGLSTSGSATSRVACFFLYLSINARVLVYSYALEMVWYEYVLVLVCILVCMVVYSVYSLNYIFFLVHVPNAYFLLFFKCFLRILTRIGSVHIQRPSESGHIFGMRIRIQIKGHIAPVYCQTVPGVFKLAPNAINIRYIPVLTVSI